MKLVYTIGHSTRTLEEFISTLLALKITLLIDVRLIPRSSRYPQFNRESLEAALAQKGIQYQWLRDLGGRRKARADSGHSGWNSPGFRGYADYMKTEQFREALESLISFSREQSVAIMCAEILWWKCHRRLISDALTVRGFQVVHIFDARKRASHIITPFLQIEEGRLTYG